MPSLIARELVGIRGNKILVVEVSRDIALPLAARPKFIFQPTSFGAFFQDVLPVIISHGSRHLIEIHVGSVLVLAPQCSNNLGIVNLELARIAIFPAYELPVSGSIGQQLQNEFP